ncbi:TonB-dependent receptor [Echinimonas agarilytica]|uniref:TonB-dependent receptor n=1 Tax=Echinimonas agarilytica TaxID=1215918 RepID=A0AA41W6S3_9GAMM|nr:TonB-dependent receptor [Echinimonas agarilytica]MCM2679985.1 TonB-dependent receptor [Echinimonas agarilytica]
MDTNRFKLNSVYMAILVATGSASMAHAAEETQQNNLQKEEVEVIQVSGIRGSLTKSADIKRSSAGVVDAISAEDIGKFPDSNLAESLQRIPGVSIDRANNEGNQVTVRGFGPSFNLVTLNGRQMPNSSVLQSAGISRSFNFREIASETVSGVEAIKTGRANITSGGIGATINIKTAKPFDYDGFKAFASATAIHDTSVEDKGDDFTPEVSGMVSNIFLDGKLGVMLSASHSERDSHRDRAGTDGWVRNRGNRDGIDTSAIDTAKNPDQSFWTAWTATSEHYDTTRERDNAQLVVQYSPIDTVEATLDYTISRFEETSTTNRSAFWFDNPTGATDANGTVYSPRNANDELNFWAWKYYEEKENDSLGVNLKWDATDTLSFMLDYHDSSSESNPDGDTAETLANLKNPPGSVALIGADFVGDIPNIIVDDSGLVGGAYDKSNIVSDLYQQRGYSMENDIKQVHLSGTWLNGGNGDLSQITFGIQNTKYEVDTYLSERFDFVDISMDALDLSFEESGSTLDEFSGYKDLFPYIAKYSAEQFLDIVTAEGKYQAPNVTTNGMEEETLAVYAALQIETELNNFPISINAGVRWEDTDVEAYSVQPGIIAMNYRHPEELSEVYDTVDTAQRLTGSYTRILPNLDIQVDVTDDIVTRASYSRTIGRASINALFPGTTTNARPEGPFQASQGNPNLLPITSDNFDLSVEWYDDNGSFASAGYFKKYVENFIGSGVVNGPLNDVNGQPLTDPSVNPRPGCPDSSATPNPACLGTASDPVITWEISTPQNLQNRELDGWEFNVQYMFADTGFGAVANYTIVDSDEEFDPFNFDETVALTGLSDTANLVGFYENETFEVRVAYNWRDDFLLALGNEPTFTEAYGQLDASISYDINENFSVFADAINVTNETVRRYGRFENQLISAEQYGPRYSFGVRANW